MMATLRIQVLFHWDSDQARQLATRLYRTFSVRPMGDGPRIPVRYGPRQADGGPPLTIDLDAEREIIVILVDERMARRARASDRRVQSSGALVIGAERAIELGNGDGAFGTALDHFIGCEPLHPAGQPRDLAIAPDRRVDELDGAEVEWRGHQLSFVMPGSSRHPPCGWNRASRVCCTVDPGTRPG